MAINGFLFILILSSLVSTNTHACNPRERSSLLSLALVDLELSSPFLNWTSSNCCHWEGIICNQDGLVSHLSLPSKGLSLKEGIFPSSLSSLANLTHLTHLNLSHNSIQCSVSQAGFFSSLRRLEVLDLSHNLLFGELKHSSPLSPIIRAVDLSNNHFHGAIPFSLFQQARNLTSFSVSNNTFSGSIPSAICFSASSPSIKLLDFSFNKFNGSLLGGLGKCSKLQVFRAGYNNLSGLVPQDLYNATTLEEIELHVNFLHGALSNNIGNLTNLKILDFSSNRFTGALPLHFGKLAKLKLMYISFNNIEGSLPPTLVNCTNLEELRMADNNLEGDISAFNFSKLGQLRKLDLMDNFFTGTLPTSLYSCKSLTAIRFSSNFLEGQIQPEILALKSLSFLSLSYNRLTNITGAVNILAGCRSLTTLLMLNSTSQGEEMTTINDMVDVDGFQKLRILALGGCELTGPIPTWLSNLKRLEILDLSYNAFTGPLPSWLGSLPRLFAINLGFNRISGEFPTELCGLQMLVSEKTAAQVSHENYQLELPIFITREANTRDLQYNYLLYFPPVILLNNNQLNGSIPTEIGQLKLLRFLNLGNNNLSGSIPDQISNLKNLNNLNLAKNHLSGKIPSSLSSLNFLASCNVSYNNLEGAIPAGTQLQSFGASAYEGNPKLCGAPLRNECLPIEGIDVDDKESQEVDSEDEIPWFHISVALGFIVGFWGVCGSLVLNKKWRYAYYQFSERVQDKLYVDMTRLKIRLRS